MQLKRNILASLGGIVAVVTIASAQMSTNGMKSMGGDMPQLDDARIAHIAVTADNIDIAYAHVALAFSKNPEVRRFAETMISDHGAVNGKAAALAKKLALTPLDNEISQQLTNNANAKMDELSQKRGSDFDRAYASNELAYHGAVNAAVRDALIPNTKNAELKKLLESAVPIFLAHEEHARHLNDAVGGGM